MAYRRQMQGYACAFSSYMIQNKQQKQTVNTNLQKNQAKLIQISSHMK